MNNIRLNGTGLFGIIAGVAGVAYAIYRDIRMSETSKKLDMAIDNVSASSNVDIEKALVDKAIERAVDREVKRAINDTARLVREDIQTDIRREVKREVDKQYKAISDEVADRISEIASDIDEVSFKDKVARMAEKKIEQKADSILNAAASKLISNIGNQVKITSDVSDLIANIAGGRNNRNGNAFRISLD